MAEWLETRGRPPAAAREPVSVSELILSYYRHAERYYGFDRDDRRGDRYCLRDAPRVVRSLYGHTTASAFGALALKACRSAMVEKGWSRTYTNAQVDRVKRMFRWGPRRKWSRAPSTRISAAWPACEGDGEGPPRAARAR